MITRKDVEHIARLARIELSDFEKEKFERELSSILDFVAQLNEIDTSLVLPLTGGTELTNVVREDGLGIPRRTVSHQKLVEAAPENRGGYVKVKAVFEKE